MKKTIEKHAVVASANDEVGRVKAVSKKRGKHTSYDECVPAKMPCAGSGSCGFLLE